MKTVLVFGVFDGLHPGHEYFLRAAGEHGEEVVVAVARDSVVKTLKNRTARGSEGERVRALRASGLVARALLGDETLGTYDVVRAVAPHTICLGYDQQGLLADLKEKIASGFLPSITLIEIPAHEPEKFHSSLLS